MVIDLSRTHKDVTFSAHWKKAAKSHMIDCSHLPECRTKSTSFVVTLSIPASSRAQIEALEEIVANDDSYSFVKAEKFGYFHEDEKVYRHPFITRNGGDLHELEGFVGSVKNTPPEQTPHFDPVAGMFMKKKPHQNLFVEFVVTKVVTFDHHSFDCAVYGGKVSFPDRSNRDGCYCCKVDRRNLRRSNDRFAAREIRGDFD